MTKERLAGMYRLSAFWLARITSELPIALVLPTCSWTVAYLMIGFPFDVYLYLSTTLIHVLGCLVAQVGKYAASMRLVQKKPAGLGHLACLGHPTACFVLFLKLIFAESGSTRGGRRSQHVVRIPCCNDHFQNRPKPQ